LYKKKKWGFSQYKDTFKAAIIERGAYIPLILKQINGHELKKSPLQEFNIQKKNLAISK